MLALTGPQEVWGLLALILLATTGLALLLTRKTNPTDPHTSRDWDRTKEIRRGR